MITLPGWGSQWTQPQSNICAEKRETMVCMMYWVPPLSGFAGKLKEAGGCCSEMSKGVGVDSAASVSGSSSPTNRRMPFLSLSRTPSIHSATIILFVEYSGYTLGIWTLPRKLDSLSTNAAVRLEFCASCSKLSSCLRWSEMKSLDRVRWAAHSSTTVWRKLTECKTHWQSKLSFKHPHNKPRDTQIPFHLNAYVWFLDFHSNPFIFAPQLGLVYLCNTRTCGSSLLKHFENATWTIWWRT